MERRCARCKEMKNEDVFAGPFPSRPRKDAYCRPCRSEYQREHYFAHRPDVIRRNGARKQEERHRRVAAILDYLRNHPCVDCGETDPVVLEFDHLGEKSFTVADGMKSKAWAAVLEEIEKCEVVCVNCHRRRTASRGAFRRADFAAERPPARRLFGPWT